MLQEVERHAINRAARHFPEDLYFAPKRSDLLSFIGVMPDARPLSGVQAKVKAWVFSSKEDAGGWTEQHSSALPDLPVLVRVLHSGINYKDALSLTRRAPISRQFPMVPGVDLVGTVIEDASGTFRSGDLVVATGHGLGETSWGAYSEQARLKPEWLSLVPEGVTAEHAAAVGTAGLTAAMAIAALERYGIAADQGPVVVTGPTGGVGSFATWLLADRGYHVVAATGRPASVPCPTPAARLPTQTGRGFQPRRWP